MAALHRKRENSMMAMLDAKPDAKGGNSTQPAANEGQQFWNDGSDGDQLSPFRKHLISTYLQVSDEEAMPLLSEYFGVALSFVALGALVRSSNQSQKKQKKLPDDDERLDLKSCSRFERMALESMVRESMERLGGLAQNAYQLESRVRDLIDESIVRDKIKVDMFYRATEAEKLVRELKALRKAEGRANERVMSIVAAKEQEWLKEKKNLQMEIEKLKETLNEMTREAKFQARRCRNPTCEHCKGVDKFVKNAKGRLSLREIHSSREASQGSNNSNGKRDASKVGCASNGLVEAPKLDRAETEVDRVLKIVEMQKQRAYQAEKLAAGGSCSSEVAHYQLLVKQKHDMETELANILKRAGMKQKSPVGAGPSTSKEVLATDEMHASVDSSEVPDHPNSEIAPGRDEGAEKIEKTPNVPEPNIHDPTFEAANYTSEQEESDMDEFERAFDLTSRDETSSPPLDNHSVSSSIAPEDVNTQPEVERFLKNAPGEDAGSCSGRTDEQQQAPDFDELVAVHAELSLGDALVPPEREREPNEGLEDDTGELAAASSSVPADPADPIEQGESPSSTQEDDRDQEPTPEATANVEQTDADMDGVGVHLGRLLDGRAEAQGGVAEGPGSSLAEGKNAVEQMVGVVEDDDTAEFSDALSTLPLDPVTPVVSDERDPSAAFATEQLDNDDAEYKENWGFEDSVGCPQEGELMENQDIPVFERNDIDDDLAGELPEPEEKRVCGLETTSELSSTPKETSRQEGECLKDNANVEGDEEVVESQQEEDPFAVKTGLVVDSKPTSEVVIGS